MAVRTGRVVGKEEGGRRADATEVRKMGQPHAGAEQGSSQRVMGVQIPPSAPDLKKASFFWPFWLFGGEKLTDG